MPSQNSIIVRNQPPGLVAIAHEFTQLLRSLRNRWMFRRKFHSLSNRAAQVLYHKDDPPVVLTGPFQGMSYLNETVWGPIVPKWLGSYECELAEIVHTIITRGYHTVIDIGSAEGYYAVGLALQMPEATVYAYDVDPIARWQTLRLGRLNGVIPRLRIGGFCSHEEIETRMHGETLLICDIEGHELGLLDPADCPGLLKLDMLVEVHERADSRVVEETLIYRFGATHQIAVIAAVDRHVWAADMCLAAGFAPLGDQLEALADEHRSAGQHWLWMHRFP